MKYKYFVSYAIYTDDGKGFGCELCVRSKKIKTLDDILSVTEYLQNKYNAEIVILNYILMR